MRVDILTLFPEAVLGMMHTSILGRAQKEGHIAIHCHQVRDYTTNKQMQVDDYPYGGGLGMVMQADPLYRCWAHVVSCAGRGHTIYMSPQGRVFCQDIARGLAEEHNHLILVCGHYEGVDERFIEECVNEEISIGDYVLTGGELPAMVVCDTVCRLIPGVVADDQCFTDESHGSGLLEYPQYSRPEVWHDRPVPPVLLSGKHSDIVDWRRAHAEKRTREKRPDMWERFQRRNDG